MRSWLLCALALCWVSAGCSKKEEEPAAGKVNSTEAAKDSGGSVTIKPNSATLPLPLVDAELKDRSELRFLGFGNKDRIYAYESMYGFRAESAGDPACFVRFRDVILAESGELIARFRMERREDDPTQFDRLWDEQWKLARPESEWAAFAAQWEIEPSEPSSEEGEWRLNVTAPDKLPPLTDLQVNKEGHSFLLTWTMYDDARNERDERYLKKNAGKPYRRSSPKIEAHLLGPTKSWLQLSIRPSYKRAELEHYSEQPVVKARYTPYWNSAKTQVLWVVEYSANEPGRRFQARQFLRSVGPQIKVIDAGSGQMAERAVIGILQSAGFSVVATDTSEAPVKGRSVYYRGQAEQEAQRIAKLLGEDVLIEELTKPGWIDIIVYLGNADPDAPTANQEAGAMVATPMDGPYGSKEAICKRLEKEGRPCSSARGRSVKGSAPFVEVTTVIAGDVMESGIETTVLLVNTGEGWFTAELFDTEEGVNSSSGQVGTLRLEELHPSPGSELVFELQTSSSLETDVEGMIDESQSSRWVCSTGKSGKPSCMELLIDYDYDFPSDGVKKRWRFTVDFLEGGKMRIDHKGTALNDRAIVGTHELIFP